MRLRNTLAHFAALALCPFGAFGQVLFSDPSLSLDELMAEARTQLGEELFFRYVRDKDDSLLNWIHFNGSLESSLNGAVSQFALEDAKAYSNPDAKILTVPEIVAARRHSVVRVECFDAEGGTIGTGTGFVFASGMIVTNRHVMKGAASASIFDRDGREHDIEGVWILRDWNAEQDAPKLDLAMLRVPSARGILDSIPLASRSPRIGESVIALGHPLGLGQSVTDGIVSARVNTPTLGNALQHTAAISPGSSGSPLLNDRGEVVGIATSFIKDGQSLNFAIAADEIRALSLSQPIALPELAKSMASEEHGMAIDALVLVLKASDEQAKAAALATALEKVKSACSLDPSNPSYWGTAALIHKQLSQWDQTVEALLHAIRLQPVPATVASFRDARENENQKTRERKDILEAFLRELDRQPASATVASYRVGQEENEQEVQERRAKAEAFFRSVLGSLVERSNDDPHRPGLSDQSHYALSVLKVAGWYKDLATAQHSRDVLRGVRPPDVLFGEIHPEQYLNNTNQALRIIRDALPLISDEDRPWFLLRLFECLVQKSHWEIVLERYGDALATAKEAATMHGTPAVAQRMSDALWGLGDHDESIKWLRKKVELAAGTELHLSSMLSLGNRLAKAGRKSEAREVVRQMRLIPDGEGYAEMLSEWIR